MKNNQTDFKSNNQTSRAMTGGIDEFRDRLPIYPAALSPRDFFRGPAELLGLTWEVCRTVWQTTPGLGSTDGGLNCARKNENSGASG